MNNKKDRANYFFGAILGHECRGKTWHIQGRHDDDNEKYESTVEWGILKNVFSDCIPTVKEQEMGEENLMIIY